MCLWPWVASAAIFQDNRTIWMVSIGEYQQAGRDTEAIILFVMNVIYEKDCVNDIDRVDLRKYEDEKKIEE